MTDKTQAMDAVLSARIFANVRQRGESKHSNLHHAAIIGKQFISQAQDLTFFDSRTAGRKSWWLRGDGRCITCATHPSPILTSLPSKRAFLRVNHHD